METPPRWTRSRQRPRAGGERGRAERSANETAEREADTARPPFTRDRAERSISSDRSQIVTTKQYGHFLLQRGRNMSLDVERLNNMISFHIALLKFSTLFCVSTFFYIAVLIVLMPEKTHVTHLTISDGFFIICWSGVQKFCNSKCFFTVLSARSDLDPDVYVLQHDLR